MTTSRGKRSARRLPFARHSWITRGVVVLALMTIGCAESQGLRVPAIGAAAPPFTAHNLAGDTVSLAGLRGKVVVLNEWATWCEPCREELPQLETLHREYSSKGLELIGVSVDGAGTALDVGDFTREHGMTYNIWLDPDKQFALKFLTLGVPETFLVDKAGIIRWRKIGALPPGDTTLALAIRQALGT